MLSDPALDVFAAYLAAIAGLLIFEIVLAIRAAREHKKFKDSADDN